MIRGSFRQAVTWTVLKPVARVFPKHYQLTIE